MMLAGLSRLAFGAQGAINRGTGLLWEYQGAAGVTFCPQCAQDEDLASEFYIDKAIQDEKIIAKFPSYTDVGTIVLVNRKYSSRTMVEISVGNSTNFSKNLKCNDGNPGTQDGVFDCQIPNSKYVVIKLTETPPNQVFSVNEILIYSEIELGQNNLVMKTNGEFGTGRQQITGNLPIAGNTADFTYYEHFSSDPGWIKLDQPVYAQTSTVVIITSFDQQSAFQYDIESESQLLGTGWTPCGSQFLLSPNAPVSRFCSQQSNRWQLRILDSKFGGTLLINYFLVFKTMQCSVPEKSVFLQQSAIHTIDVALGTMNTFTLPQIVIFPHACAFTHDSIQVFSDSSLVTTFTNSQIDVMTSEFQYDTDANVTVTNKAGLAGTTVSVWFSTTVHASSSTNVEPFEMQLNFIDSCETTVLDPFPASFTEHSGPYDYYSQLSGMQWPSDSVATLAGIPTTCGNREIILEDLDVGGVPSYFAAGQTIGTSGDNLYFQAYGGQPNFANFGDHNVKIRVQLVDYPTIFIYHVIVVHIVCGGGYSQATSVDIDTYFPTDQAVHDVGNPTDTAFQLSQFSIQNYPCFDYDSFYVLDNVTDLDVTSHFSGFDPLTFKIYLKGDPSLIGTTRYYDMYINAKLVSSGNIVEDDQTDTFEVEWTQYCAPGATPTLNYGPLASVTSFYPEPSTNTDMLVQLTTFTINPAEPCFYYYNFEAFDLADLTTDVSNLFGFDPATAMLTMIGDPSLNGLTRSYKIYVQIADPSNTLVDSVLLESIDVQWGTMGCDPNPSLTKTWQATTLNFNHDPSDTPTVAQLSTYSINPAPPCYTYSTFKVFLQGVGVDMTGLFYYYETSQQIEFIGDAAAAGTTAVYEVKIAILDANGNPYAQLLLDTITVSWFTCTISPTLTIDQAAQSSLFFHDPTLGVDVDKQLSTYHLNESPDCWQITGWIVKRLNNGDNKSSHFGYDIASQVITLIGFSGGNSAYLRYQLYVQVANIVTPSNPLIELWAEDFDVKWCSHASLNIIQNPPTQSFSREVNYNVPKIVPLATFSVGPGVSCYEYSGFGIREQPSDTDALILFSYDNDPSTSMLTLIGDASVVGSTRGYEIRIFVVDPVSQTYMGSLVLGSISVQWKDPPVCDVTTTSLVAFTVADVTTPYHSPTNFNIQVPADTLSINRNDNIYCGYRTAYSFDVDQSLPSPSYLQVPTSQFNSGDQMVVQVSASDISQVGVHNVHIRITLFADSALFQEVPFTVTFTCDGAPLPQISLTGSPMVAPPWTHDVLLATPTTYATSPWNFNPGNPCYSAVDWKVEDSSLNDMTALFPSYDPTQITPLLQLMGDPTLAGTSETYKLYAEFHDQGGNFVTWLLIETFQVQWTSSCPQTASLTIDTPAPTNILIHDPNNMTPTPYQLALYHLNESTACHTIIGWRVRDVDSQTDRSSRYTFNYSTSQGTLIGQVSEATISDNYQMYIIVQSVAFPADPPHEVLLQDFTVKWCMPPYIEPITVAPTLAFQHDPSSLNSKIEQLTTFSVAPPHPCYAFGGYMIVDTATQSDQMALFSYSNDPSSSQIALYGDTSLQGQTIAYDFIVKVSDAIYSSTFLDDYDLVLDTFTVFWDAAQCDITTTSLAPFSIGSIVSLSYLETYTINLTVPTDTLATSENDPNYCGQRMVTAEETTGWTVPNYMTLPTTPVNSGDPITIQVMAADMSQVGIHHVQVIFTLVGDANVEVIAQFSITFICDNSILPQIIINASPPVAGPYVHDVLSPTFTLVTLSDWTVDLGAPCFQFDSAQILETATGDDLQSHFNSYTAASEMLEIQGEPSLAGQTIAYILLANIKDTLTNGIITTQYVEEFDVIYFSSCDSAILDPIMVADFQVPHGQTETQSILIPADSVGTSLADPSICGDRQVTLEELNTGVINPTFLSVTISGGQITILAQVQTPADLGNHPIKLTVKLLYHPGATETTANFQVTFECDPSILAPTFSIVNPQTQSYFQHDPNGSVPTLVQLATFSIAPGAPCFTYYRSRVYNLQDNTDMVSSPNFTFDPTTSQLGLIGDTADLNNVIEYEWTVQFKSLSGSIVSEESLGTFTVAWIPDEDCTSTILLPDLTTVNFNKVMVTGSQNEQFIIPNRKALTMGDTTYCGLATATYMRKIEQDIVPYFQINVGDAAEGDRINLIIAGVDIYVMAGGTSEVYYVSVSLVDYPQVAHTEEITVTYLCPAAPQGRTTSGSYTWVTDFVYSLTQMGPQTYTLNLTEMKPDNCNFVAISAVVLFYTDNLVSAMHTFDVPTHSITMTSPVADPFALPTLHNTLTPDRYVVEYTVQESTTLQTWTMAADDVQFRYMFENVYPSTDCPNSQVFDTEETFQYTPISLVYTSSSQTITVQENKDTYGERYNEFYYCGGREHYFVEQGTGNPVPWITYVEGDTNLHTSIITIDPSVLPAGSIRTWTVEWRTKLTLYSTAGSSSPQILTINITCPPASMTQIGTASGPVLYTLNSGPVEYTGLMNTFTDDTSGQCYSYSTSVRMADSSNDLVPFVTYEWQTAKITIDTFDPAYSGQTISVYNEITFIGINIVITDFYSIQFQGGCATTTIVSQNDITFPAREFAPIQLKEYHKQPADTYGLAIGDFFACGKRGISRIQELMPDGTLVPQTWLGYWRSPDNDDMEYKFFFGPTSPSSVIGQHKIEIDWKLQDWQSNGVSSHNVNVEFLCPAEPYSISVSGGTAQDPNWPYVFDTTQGTSAAIDLSLESYVLEPTFCNYGLTHTVKIDGSGTDISSQFGAIYISDGSVNLNWDGTTMGIISYEWRIVVNSPLAPEIVQTFKISYVDFSTLDCDTAVWIPNTPEIAITDQWMTYTSAVLQPIWTDIDKTAGTIDFCGPRNYLVSYTDGVEGWMAVDVANSLININYSDQKALGTNNAVLKVSLANYPAAVVLDQNVKLDVTCPASHTSVDITFQNTQSMTPTIYYDSTQPNVQQISLNVRQILPYDSDDLGQVTMACFTVTQSRIKRADTNVAVGYITVQDFYEGLIEIDLYDASYAGQQVTYNWEIDIDDGTSGLQIQSFTVDFGALASCQETILESGWPTGFITQKMFEPNPQKFPLPVPTDSLAELQGVPTHCGKRTYRVLEKSQMIPISWVKIDQTSQEIWVDVQAQGFNIGLYEILLEISLTDHNLVAPVYMQMNVNIICPDQHHSIKFDTSMSNTLNYDVTEAYLQNYVLDSIYLLPKNCFSASNLRLTDQTGATISYANVSPTEITSDPVAQPFTAYMNLVGVQMFDWVANPITLHWTIDVSDGQTVNAKDLTIQGVSTCSTATMSVLPDQPYQVLPENTPALISETTIFDSVTTTKPAPDYCGPQVISVLQTDLDGEQGPVFTKGTITAPAPGALEIAFNEATHLDYGTLTLVVTVHLEYFPTVTTSLTVTMDYQCPAEALLVINKQMAITEFIYYVNDLDTLNAELSSPQVVSVCHGIDKQYFSRADTQTEVDFIQGDLASESMTLYTEDVDQALRGNTITFNWMLDLTDGTKGNIVATFTVEFIGINNEPYFDPPLTSYFQIYKQNKPFLWEYEMPPYFDDDVRDTASIWVDMNETAEFMTMDANFKLSIPDLSIEEVIPGTYKILVFISDGSQTIQNDVTVIIYPAPVLKSEDPEPDSEVTDETEEEVSEEETTEDTSEEETTDESGETSSSSGSSGTGSETDEELPRPEIDPSMSEEEVEQVQTIHKVFDWRAAFKKKEKKLTTSGQIFQIQPPSPRLEYIQQTGEVRIEFDQDMRIVPSVDMITKGQVKIGKKTYPILDIEIIPGSMSSKQHLGFEWVTTSMTKRTVTFKLVFQQAIYVSANEEPDKLRVTFRDRYMFVSTTDLAIAKQKPQAPVFRQLQGWNDEGEEENDPDDSFIYLERELPTQLQEGSAAAQVQEALSSASDGSKMAMASNFVVNILISASLNQLWAMINTQQLMVMMPLFKIEMPANAGIFFKHVMEIAAFDFYDFGDIIHEQMQIEPTDPLDQNFEAVGFESQYWMVNLGTMFVFYLIYITLAMFIAPCCMCFRSRSKRIKRCSKKLNKSIYWGVLITLINESYIIFVVCVLINLQIFDMSSMGLSIMSVGGATFISLGVLIPTCFILYIFCNFNNLKDPQMRDKYGAVYEELRLKTGKIILLQPSFFLFRRFALGVAICLVGKVLIWQIFIMSSQIIIQTIIVGMNVFQDASKRRLEYFNELILMLTMYTIICYSPWIADVELKFYIGYVTISFVISHLIVNLFLIFRTTFLTCRNDCRRKFIMRKYRKDRKKLQKSLKENHSARYERTRKLFEEGRKAKELADELESEEDEVKNVDGLSVINEQESDEELDSNSNDVRTMNSYQQQNSQILLVSKERKDIDAFQKICADGAVFLGHNFQEDQLEISEETTPRLVQEQQIVEESKKDSPVNLEEFEVDLYANENKLGQIKKQIQTQAMKDIEEQSAYFLKGRNSLESQATREDQTSMAKTNWLTYENKTLHSRQNQISQDQLSLSLMKLKALKAEDTSTLSMQGKISRRKPFASSIMEQQAVVGVNDDNEQFPWHEYADINNQQRQPLHLGAALGAVKSDSKKQRVVASRDRANSSDMAETRNFARKPTAQKQLFTGSAVDRLEAAERRLLQDKKNSMMMIPKPAKISNYVPEQEDQRIMSMNNQFEQRRLGAEERKTQADKDVRMMMNLM